jgi:hypothetical protein
VGSIPLATDVPFPSPRRPPAFTLTLALPVPPHTDLASVESERQDALEASPVSTSYTEKRPASAHSRAYLMAAIGFMGIFLFGYDTYVPFLAPVSTPLTFHRGVGGAVLVLPSFAGSFGVHGLPGQSKAEAAKRVANLQGNVVAILQGGAFFGALGAAPFTNRFGRKLVSGFACGRDRAGANYTQTLMVGNAIFIAGAVIQTASFSSIGQCEPPSTLYRATLIPQSTPVALSLDSALVSCLWSARPMLPSWPPRRSEEGSPACSRSSSSPVSPSLTGYVAVRAVLGRFWSVFELILSVKLRSSVHEAHSSPMAYSYR